MIGAAQHQRRPGPPRGGPSRATGRRIDDALDAALSADRRAVEEAWRRLHPAIARLVGGWTWPAGPLLSRDDLTADVCERLLAGRRLALWPASRLRGRVGPRFLRLVCRATLVDALRAHLGRTFDLSRAADLHLDEGLPARDDVAGGAVGADLLRRLAAALPPASRVVLVGDLAGYHGREIAARLGVHESRVTQRRAVIRDLLAA